jgi:D-beta-D-heptose 7-phosphate kinase/D-beta-D-heptose 1-phosphate adenosyltransferase
MPGGAANVACNLAYLGCRVRLIGITGQDETALILRREIERAPGIEFAPFLLPRRPTSVKTRYRAGGQQILRVDEELTDPLDDATLLQLTEVIIGSIKMADVIVLSDYAKGCLPPQVIARAVRAAKKAGKIVIADPKLADFSAYADVDILTPNLAELQLAVDAQLDDLESIAAAASDTAASHRIGAVMATLSARGIMLANAEGAITHEAAAARDVFDVSGAGDTVVATLAAATGWRSCACRCGAPCQSRCWCCRRQIRDGNCQSRRNDRLHDPCPATDKHHLLAETMRGMARRGVAHWLHKWLFRPSSSRTSVPACRRCPSL